MLTSDSENQTTASLESIISTAELSGRRTRAPNHVAENDALIALAEKMATSPNDILQKLAETALNLCHAQTCGISLLDSDGVRFLLASPHRRMGLSCGGQHAARIQSLRHCPRPQRRTTYVPPRTALRLLRGGHPVD